MKHFEVMVTLRAADQVRIFKRMRAANIPIEGIVRRPGGLVRFNFADETTPDQMILADLTIQQYDPDAADAAEEQERQQRVNDLAPLRSIAVLLAEIEADTADVQGANFNALRAIVERSLTRERQVVRALHRLAEAMMGNIEAISGGE